MTEPDTPTLQVAFGLQPRGATVLRLLLAQPIVTASELRGHFAKFDAALAQVRTALAGHGVEVTNRKSEGWLLAPADRAKLLAVVAEYTAPFNNVKIEAHD